MINKKDIVDGTIVLNEELRFGIIENVTYGWSISDPTLKKFNVRDINTNLFDSNIYEGSQYSNSIYIPTIEQISYFLNKLEQKRLKLNSNITTVINFKSKLEKSLAEKDKTPDTSVNYIYRIDGNLCGKNPIIGISHYETEDLAVKNLVKNGFYLETRKWEASGEHSPKSADYIWYDKRLSDDGYAEDNTSYAIIQKIRVNYR